MFRAVASIVAPGLPCTHRSRQPWVLTLIMAFLATVGSEPAHAAQVRVIDALPDSSGEVGVLSVLVDFGDEPVDDPSQIVVTLDGAPANVIAVGPALDRPPLHEVVVEVPEGLSPGTYRLSVQLADGVSSGAVQPFSVLDVTLGAVGLQGPQGEPGPQGETGPPGPGILGQSCPEGEFVSGFETGGTLICTPLTTGGGGGSSVCEDECALRATTCRLQAQVVESFCALQKSQCVASGGGPEDCAAAEQACLAGLPDCAAEEAACLVQCVSEGEP